MDRLDRTIQVAWQLRVRFTSQVFNPLNPVLADVLRLAPDEPRPRVLVVVDAGLARCRPALLAEIAGWFAAHADVAEFVPPVLVLDGGERSKNSPAALDRVLAAIHQSRIDRHSFVIAVGGGALLDVVGYATATAHRGCRHIRVPSTTLSQADSGVGVKNGINAFGQKNFLGTFAPPSAVINDFELLASLPERERRAGFVEAVKVACIRDRDFFEEIERSADRLRQFEPEAVQRIIRHCARLHLDHIADGGDPFEFGSARPLDFGHWAAHKLELLSEFRIPHGDAVAIGIALDVLYSRDQGWLDADSVERVLALLEALGFSLFAGELMAADGAGKLRLLSGLEEFKEHLGGALCVTMLRGIGSGFEVHEMEPPLILAAIRELQSRSLARPDIPVAAAAPTP